MRLDTAYAFEMFFKKFEYSSGKLTKLSARYSTSSCSNAPFLDVISADIKSFISISPLTSCTLLLSFFPCNKDSVFEQCAVSQSIFMFFHSIIVFVVFLVQMIKRAGHICPYLHLVRTVGTRKKQPLLAPQSSAH